MRDVIRSLLEEHAEISSDDEAPLEVESFVLVVVAEALEEKFGIRVAAKEMRPENFGSVARIAAYVDGKLGERK
jgi:acyl carrier protein